MRTGHLAALAALCLWTLPAAPAAAVDLDNARAEALAKKNAAGKAGYAFLLATARRIEDPKVRAAVLDILKNPAPTFLSLYPDAPRRTAVRARLVEEGLLEGTTTVTDLFPPVSAPDKAAMSFLAAPGGTPDHHHDYPGGLAEHTAFNVQAALDLAKNYQVRYGIRLDQDLVIAAPILHDAYKAYVLQWTADGSLLEQATVGGTSSHHPFGIAESIHRGLPAELVVAQAAAHDPPAYTPEKVIRYIRAASVLAGVDPVEKGYLARAADGSWSLAKLSSIEATVNHLSDHDYMITDPAGKAVAASLERLIRAEAKSKDVTVEMGTIRWARARIKGQVPHMRLYAELRAGGDDAVGALLAAKKVPLLLPEDAPAKAAAAK